MTQRFSDKDPSDIISLTFDFSANGPSVATPTVTISLAAGADPAAAAMLLGSPIINGATVVQRVQNGLHGCDYVLTCTADVGVDRISIDAILPVRDRPILTSATPIYLTEAAFERRFGADELRELLADGASYTAAENEAASLIDGFLSSRYTLPLSSVPALVVGWAGDLTRYKLWEERAPQEVRQRYEDAMDQLKMLAGGKISLPPTAAGTPVTPGVVFGGFSAERVFTQDTLAEF